MACLPGKCNGRNTCFLNSFSSRTTTKSTVKCIICIVDSTLKLPFLSLGNMGGHIYQRLCYLEPFGKFKYIKIKKNMIKTYSLFKLSPEPDRALWLEKRLPQDIRLYWGHVSGHCWQAWHHENAIMTHDIMTHDIMTPDIMTHDIMTHVTS